MGKSKETKCPRCKGTLKLSDGMGYDVRRCFYCGGKGTFGAYALENLDDYKARLRAMRRSVKVFENSLRRLQRAAKAELKQRAGATPK